MSGVSEAVCRQGVRRRLDRTSVAWALVAATGCGRVAFDTFDASGPGDGRPACTAGHDEDLDGVDDACDVCPHISDLGQPDADGDGVGDACDPNPSVAAEQIVVFEPFTSQPANWIFVGPPAMFDGESMHVDCRNTEWSGRYTMVPATDRFVIGGFLGVRGPTIAQTVALEMYQGTPRYFCELYERGTMWLQQFTWTFNDANFMHQGIEPLGSPVENVVFQLMTDHTPPNISCRGDFGGMILTSPGTIPAIAAADVMIQIVDRVVRIDYLVQIRTQ